MKTIKLVAWCCLLFVAGLAKGQERGEVDMTDSTGLPGDHFSLQGALALFKDSKSLEDFEKKINSKDNAINNLDLNGDGKIDFVKVVDNVKDDAHAIVLQTMIAKNESQDIAVIEIEKKGNESAVAQIIGDEELYPKNTIVEPAEEGENSDPGNVKKGPAAFSPGVPFVFVNVWFWPSVRFIYAPAYVVWVSPWYWDYYPPWWSPWAPYSWRWHHMHCWHYHHHYHYADFHRTTYAHQVYAPRRVRSDQVTNRYRESHVRYNANPTGRPRNNVSGTGRTTRPAGKDVSRPQVRPESRPQEMPPGKPQVRPSTKPDRQPQVQPSRPKSKPQVRPLSRPSQQSRPSKPSGNRHR
jgi:hypothetical protein